MAKNIKELTNSPIWMNLQYNMLCNRNQKQKNMYNIEQKKPDK